MADRAVQEVDERTVLRLIDAARVHPVAGDAVVNELVFLGAVVEIERLPAARRQIVGDKEGGQRNQRGRDEPDERPPAIGPPEQHEQGQSEGGGGQFHASRHRRPRSRPLQTASRVGCCSARMGTAAHNASITLTAPGV